MAVFEDDYTALNYKAVTPRLRKQSKSRFTSPASSDPLPDGRRLYTAPSGIQTK